MAAVKTPEACYPGQAPKLRNSLGQIDTDDTRVAFRGAQMSVTRKCLNRRRWDLP